MKDVALGTLSLLAAALPAQNVVVDASGTLTLGWQGNGPAQWLTQTVNGPTTLQSGQVGSAALTLGVTTTLTLSAQSPPWPGPTVGWWSNAAADVLVTYAATVPVAGILRLSLLPACSMGILPAVDVDDDGLFEIAPTGVATQVDVPAVLGPRPIVVRIVDSTVSFGAACVSTASIQFLAQPANLATAGVACGSSLAATLLSPTPQPGRLTLHVDDHPTTPAATFAALAFGATPLVTGPSCGPGLIADGWLFLTPTPAGFDLPIPLGAGLVGSVELQYVGLQLPLPSQLQWSNRVRLTLP